MDINTIILLPALMYIIFFGGIIGGLSYYLGKRKSDNYKVITFVGFILAMVPPIGFLYVGLLALKDDRTAVTEF